MSIWNRLGISPTSDLQVIKKAYAAKSRECHPEDNPEGHRLLREAYRQARRLVESGKASPLSIPSRLGIDAAWRSPVVGHDAPPAEAEPPRPESDPEYDYDAIIEESSRAKSSAVQREAVRSYFRQVQDLLDTRRPAGWKELFAHPVFLEYRREPKFCRQLLDLLRMRRIRRAVWQRSLKPYLDDWAAECPFEMQYLFRGADRERPPNPAARIYLVLGLVFWGFAWFIRYSMEEGFGVNGETPLLFMFAMGIVFVLAALVSKVKNMW